MIQPISQLVRGAAAVGAFISVVSSVADAQLPITRADAQRAALAAGTRVALARVDTAAAIARLLTARTLQQQ